MPQPFCSDEQCDLGKGFLGCVHFTLFAKGLGLLLQFLNLLRQCLDLPATRRPGISSEQRVRRDMIRMRTAMQRDHAL